MTGSRPYIAGELCVDFGSISTPRVIGNPSLANHPHQKKKKIQVHDHLERLMVGRALISVVVPHYRIRRL